MKYILDDGFKEKNSRERKMDKRGFAYSMIMFIGGVLFLKYFFDAENRARIDQLVVMSLITQTTCIAISVIFELLVRIFKKKKKPNSFSKLFWLERVEKGFVIWLVLAFVITVDHFLY